MNCPFCEKPMEEGVLNSRHPILWSQSASGLPFPTQKEDVVLGKAFGLLRPRSWLCRDCRKVITEY